MKRPKDVRAIVTAYLKQNGFDGLYTPIGDCACGLDDIIPCYAEDLPHCRPGYRQKCNVAKGEFHIREKRPPKGSKCPCEE